SIHKPSKPRRSPPSRRWRSESIFASDGCESSIAAEASIKGSSVDMWNGLPPGYSRDRTCRAAGQRTDGPPSRRLGPESAGSGHLPRKRSIGRTDISRQDGKLNGGLAPCATDRTGIAGESRNRGTPAHSRGVCERERAPARPPIRPSLLATSEASPVRISPRFRERE